MIEEVWSKFVDITGIDGSHQAFAFADSIPELATELALLVRDGPKRATAGLLSDYGDGTEEGQMPVVGELNIVLDGGGSPVCVIRTTEVAVRRFGDVDEAFAWDEGEGDRTLSWWRQAHTWYFLQQGTRIDEDTLMVLERFELLWP